MLWFGSLETTMDLGFSQRIGTWFPSSANFTSEVFRLVHFTSLNRLGIRGKLELQVSPTAAARHEKNETRDGIYLHPMSFRTLLPSCKLPSGFTSRASGSARSVRSAHRLPCLSWVVLLLIWDPTLLSTSGTPLSFWLYCTTRPYVCQYVFVRNYLFFLSDGRLALCRALV